MTKKRFLHTLTQILSHFDDDPEVKESVEILQNKIAEKDDWEEDMGTSTAMEVPKEIAGKPGYFAVFSDGACRGNPGPGAWGAVGQDNEGQFVFESSGVAVLTTNHRLELAWAI